MKGLEESKIFYIYVIEYLIIIFDFLFFFNQFVLFDMLESIGQRLVGEDEDFNDGDRYSILSVGLDVFIVLNID